MTPRNVSQLVAHQVKKWDLAQLEHDAEAPKPYWPVIAISRQFGACGAAVGKVLAERLGFSFWDRELIDAIATESGAYASLLASVDEQHRGLVNDFIEGVILGARYTRSEYLSTLVRVVSTLAHHGRAVIVGRGINYVLGDRAFRFRAVASLSHRVAHIAQRQQLGEEEARERVRRVDDERSDFVKHHFRSDVDDPASYDLLVNTATLSVAAAADLVESGYRVRFGALPLRDREALWHDPQA